jgi:sigma-54 dependent transcriptional regulator, acetoin dehydrogenase operon transcriptional activator AcoR
MHNLGTAERVDLVALLAVEDEELANQSPVRLLITAPTAQAVETLARRIHGAGPRAQFPFVQTGAVELPVGPELLKEYCARLLDSAAGGTLLVSAVEEMPATVQDAMIDLLGGLESARVLSAMARLISGTTVSLRDRVAAGTFSERLFYRLNIIHLTVGNGSEAVLA